MSLDHSDLEALAKLERFSRRTRPFLLIGLLAIALAFVIIVIYLQNERVAAQRRSEELAQRVETLNATLHDLQVLTARKDAEVNPRQEEKVSALLANATAQVADLKVANVDPTSAPRSEAPSGPIRVFLHITSEDQRPMAAKVQADLQTLTLDGREIVVPGIELVTPRRTGTLRCLKAPDCQWAPKLLRLVNGRLASPGFVLLDLSGTYDKAPNVRPGTIELWFADGPIALKDPS